MTLVDEAEDIFVIHVLLVKEVKLMRLWTTRVYCQVIFLSPNHLNISYSLVPPAARHLKHPSCPLHWIAICGV